MQVLLTETCRKEIRDDRSETDSTRSGRNNLMDCQQVYDVQVLWHLLPWGCFMQVVGSNLLSPASCSLTGGWILSSFNLVCLHKDECVTIILSILHELVLSLSLPGILCGAIRDSSSLHLKQQHINAFSVILWSRLRSSTCCRFPAFLLFLRQLPPFISPTPKLPVLALLW